MKTLEKDRTRRYATASEFAADVERHLNSEPVVAAAPSHLYKVRKFVRRHRIGVAASLLVVVTLVIGATGTTLGLVHANIQRREAVANFQKALDNLNKIPGLIYALADQGISPREHRQRSVKLLQYVEGFLQESLKESGGDPAIRHNLGLAYKQQAEFHLISGEYRNAELAYRKAVGVFEKLVEDLPERDDLIRELVYAKNALGTALEAQDREQEAEEVYGSSLALFKTLDNPFIFGTPRNLGPIVNSQFVDSGSCISTDGRSLYFASNRPGGSGNYDLWVTTRPTPDGEWTLPVNLTEVVNSPAYDGHPSISADGLSLYFDSWRVGSQGRDLWMTTRETVDSNWTTPVNLDPPVNSSLPEYHAEISNDGRSLYFRSSRSGSIGGSDIWVARRRPGQDSWSEPVNLGSTVNTDFSDSHPSISSNGLMLFFGSTRPGGFGTKTDIWVTMRSSISKPWGTPMNLGPPVNSAAREMGPSISSDGRMLYFSAELRPGGSGSSDLWQVQILSTPFDPGPFIPEISMQATE